MHFIIVGPGIMPIPPSGWGACEILIWDYACELRKLGHIVDILNTKDMGYVIRTIIEKKPDVVHIQYDDYSHIVPSIVNHAKLVALTSHYGYLEQPSRWGGYATIFSNMVTHSYPNYYHFVLSSGIGRIYREHGVQPDRIMVVPNGARADQFRYTTDPLYPMRSIVVGKMEVRKGQYRVQHNPEVWFAGNQYDSSFDYSNSRWLGEWSKDTLYQNLTDYGNLVLLSDGEADPLVVKEALMAGLGVVVSEWGAANLDTTLPFITVIPANRLDDREYVDEQIRANRERSIAMRETIRAYGMQFDWSVLVPKYVEAIREKLPPTIGAYFQCYKNPYATYKTLESFREHYPTNTVVLVSDNGYDYTEMAKHFNCIYYRRNKSLPLIYENREEIEKGSEGQHVIWGRELIQELCSAFERIPEEYVLWLEDDVVVNGVVTHPFPYDINGYSPNMYWDSLKDALSISFPHIRRENTYRWSGHGGSVFHKSSILHYLKQGNMIEHLLQHWHIYPCTFNIACDFLLSVLVHLNQGTVGDLPETRDGPRDIRIASILFQHQYKKYYGVPLPNELQSLVSYSS